jgi:hypothetical protein
VFIFVAQNPLFDLERVAISDFIAVYKRQKMEQQKSIKTQHTAAWTM